MTRRFLASACLAIGLALVPAAAAPADELLAWWSFNNSFNSDQGDGLRTGAGFYFPVILNNPFDDGFYTGPTAGFVAPGVRGDLMYPVYDRFQGTTPGALIPSGADDFSGSMVGDTATLLAAFGPGFGAVLDVSDLVGANDGTIGASGDAGNTWGSLAGTALNRPTGTFGGGSLAMSGPANNGRSFTIEADLSMYRDISVSWALQSTATGFDTRVVSVSTDGVTFVDVLTDTGRPSSFALRGASAGSLLDGASTAFIRWTVDGATSAFGNNRFDNIQLRGTLIPEPSSVVLMGLGVAGLAGVARLRRRPR